MQGDSIDAAIGALTAYARKNAHATVRHTARLITCDEEAAREAAIKTICERMESLPASATFHDFDLLLKELAEHGFYPSSDLVMEVARAFRDAGRLDRSSA